MSLYEFFQRLDADPWDPALVALFGIKNQDTPDASAAPLLETETD